MLYFKEYWSKGLQDFIDEFYEIKSTSKGAKKLAAKIPLNASYGKFAEKVIRVVGHHELSKEGYVHYVRDSEKVDAKSMLSVIVGARITSLSRIDLMKSIRQVSKGNPKKNFIYCDTDSIHSFTNNIETDDKILGMFKNESPDKTPYRDCIYIAPKSYVMLHKSYPEVINKDTFVVHCKGVNTNAVKKLISGYDIEYISKIFRPNYPIASLTGINAIGGKALIYKDKFILKGDDNEVCEVSINDGNEVGGTFYEL